MQEEVGEVNSTIGYLTNAEGSCWIHSGCYIAYYSPFGGSQY
jgi:hypothetical protein